MAEREGLIDSMNDPAIEKIADAISDYIHGEARDHVSQSLASAGDDLDQTIAAMSYQILTQAVEQVEQEKPDVLSMDAMLGLATETIDYLIEVAQAVNAPIKDEQDLRARSMIEMVQIHMAKVQDDPEQKAIAEEMLAEMMQDGTYEQGMSFVEKKIKEEGGDPSQARQAGEQMAAPRRDPLAEGVQRGLMDQGGGV